MPHHKHFNFKMEPFSRHNFLDNCLEFALWVNEIINVDRDILGDNPLKDTCSSGKFLIIWSASNEFWMTFQRYQRTGYRFVRRNKTILTSKNVAQLYRLLLDENLPKGLKRLSWTRDIWFKPNNGTALETGGCRKALLDNSVWSLLTRQELTASTDFE